MALSAGISLTGTVGTEPRLIAEVGPPPWDAVQGQVSCKYATPACAQRIATPWVLALIERMQEGLTESRVIDIRWWEHLEVGDVPGLSMWHYDCYLTDRDKRPAEHRLYFAGANCRTQFEPDIRPPEGWIVGYTHNDRHRIMPAESAGPRLLVRVSQVSITPANHIGPPPLFRRKVLKQEFYGT